MTEVDISVTENGTNGANGYNGVNGANGTNGINGHKNGINGYENASNGATKTNGLQNGIHGPHDLNGHSYGNWLSNGHANGINGHANGTNGHTNGSDANSPKGRPAFEPIAICGMACRLPGGVNSPTDLWDFLIAGRDGRSRVPKSRFNIDGFYSPTKRPGTINTEYGYFLDESVNLGGLDNSFFSMGRTELEWLDPQQRILLEVARESLDDAGEIDWKGSNIGVYVGNFTQDWYDVMVRDIRHSQYAMTTSNDFMVSERLSHELDLRGPSLTIRTACSSALTGLNEACMAIGRGDCESALVGGTNLILAPDMGMRLADMGVLSPDGSCKTFSADANGYARGEAIVSIYIKSLSAAIRDGNPIRSVISGSAANFDGKTNPLTMPSANLQESLIRRAYEVAGISSISKTALFECHGTGTNAGDPIETEAIASVFGQEGIHLGAVKPNLGHSEGASGLTAVLKATLALEHRTIPPNIKYLPLNPKIPFKRAKLLIPGEPTNWPEDRDERVSINAFGVGGANAHVIVESAASFLASREQQKKPNHQPQLLLFSANTAQSLKDMERGYQSLLNQELSLDVPDIAYTLANRREHLKFRSFAVATKDKFELANSLASSPSDKGAPTLVMVFTGQGAAWPQFGRELLRNNLTFSRTIDALEKHLCKLGASWSLRDEIRKPTKTSRVYEAEFAQPLCTALQLALVDTLASVGIKPAAVVGHSSGEIGAAYAAGALTAEEAIAVAFQRGVSTKGRTERGGMAAVGLSWDEAHCYLQPGVVVACDNSPSSVTLSGDADKLDNVVADIKEAHPNAPATVLKVEKAYHSHHMVALGSEYHEAMNRSGVVGKVPTIPFFSSVTGRLLGTTKGDQLNPRYWQANLERPVLFKSAVTAILQSELTQNEVFLELGPHSTLAGPLRQILTSESSKAAYVPSLVRRQNSVENLLQALGKLYTLNVQIDFKALMAGGACVAGLPNYPWDHSKSYWFESRVSKEWRGKQYPDHCLLGTKLPESTDNDPAWRNLLAVGTVPWVMDHKLGDTIVFPLSGYVGIAAEAARQATGIEDGVSFRNLAVTNALVLSEDTPTEIITNLHRKRLTDTLSSDWFEFSVSSHNGHVWTKHCFGEVKAETSETAVLDKTQQPNDLPRKVDSAKWYETERRGGLYYGPSFAGLEQIRSSTGSPHEAQATLKNNKWADATQYHLHPAVLDAYIQLQILSVYNGIDRHYKRLLGSKIDHMTIFRSTEEVLDLHATSTPSGEGYVGDGSISAGSNTVIKISGSQIVIFDEAGGAGESNTPLTARSEWVPHVDFQDKSILIKPAQGNEIFMPALNELARAAISLAWTTAEGIDVQTPHLVRYKEWLREQASEQTRSTASVESLAQSLEGTSAAHVARTIATVSANLEAVLKGEKSALSALTLNGGIDHFAEFLRDQDDSAYFRTLAHTKPNLRILEVGAGLSQRTRKITDNMTRADGQPLYAQYIVTDASAGLISVMEDRLKGIANIEFVTLDINSSIADQGFEAGPFDLIIAANVVNACSNVQSSLRNLHGLLAPGGRLLLEEPQPGMAWAKFALGTLPGWWNKNTIEPFINQDQWQQELVSAGFADVAQLNWDSAHITSNVFIARSHLPKQLSKKITLLVDSVDEKAHPSYVVNELSARGYEISYVTLDQTPTPGQDVLALLEEKKPFFEDIDATKLANLKMFFSKITDGGLLWVTRPSSVGVKDPRYAQVIGLTRTVRSEMALDIATLEIDGVESTPQTAAVADIFGKFGSREDDGVLGPDYEYAYLDDQVLVHRIFPSALSHDNSLSSTSKEAMVAQSEPGRLDTLGWVSTIAKAPQADEVQVEVYASGLNFRDVLVGMQIIPGRHEPKFGYEAAGIVRRAGPDVSGLRVGDRVLVLGINTFATVLNCREQMVKKIPDNISFTDAACIPLVFITAIYGLKELGRLSKGQSVLIHSGTGGVGLAAIQVARFLGAEIYMTVGNEKKAQFLVDNYEIPRNRIFNSRNTSFVDDLLRETGGRGVDVALNSLAGELLHATWECIAPWGTMVEIGKRDILGSAQLNMKPFLENRSYCCLDAEQMRIERPDISSRTLDFAMECFANGHFRPIPVDRVFSAPAVLEAFRYMQQGKHIGKIIVEIRNGSGDLLVEDVGTRKEDTSLKLNSDASYLLIGGLGGLGRSMATWMVEHGAKHLTFLSRSAGRGKYDEDIKRDLESMGSTVQLVRGDVTQPQDVARAIEGVRAPLKGIVQMSMVLRDQMFDGMSIEDWDAVVRPKVQGTWNLHNAALNKKVDLDFFLLFSSLSGVLGQVGQANYASANTFLDAFVQYRAGLNLPTTTIDLGAMEGVGYLSENQELLKKMKGTGWRAVQENELLGALELAIGSAIARSRKDAPTAGDAFLLGLVPTTPLSSPDASTRMRRDVRMAVYHTMRGGDGKTGSATDGLRSLLSTIKKDSSVLDSADTSAQLAIEIGKKLLALVLAGDAEVDIAMRTADLGLDSLVAVELQAWWRLTFGFDISTLEILSMGTLEALGKRAADGLSALYG